MRDITGIHYLTNKPCSIEVSDGKIASLEELTDVPSQQNLSYIGPGLIDLQVNGFGGHDINTEGLTQERLEKIANLLLQQGVTNFFPTIITNSEQRIYETMQLIANSCEETPLLNNMITGIHLEGPFISDKDGARGAHPLEHIQAPSWELVEKWQKAAGGRIKIITLSPEWPNVNPFIKKCNKNNLIVSIGHTAASPMQIREAIKSGIKLSTHLGNGCHQMLHRHQNFLWEQLAADQVTASIIADGFHLPEAVLKVILRAKKENVLLVSDSVYLSGMPPGEYETHIGGHVVLSEEGKLHLAGDPNILAGSAQPLSWGISHLVKKELATLGQAWNMASIRPAKLLGCPCQKGLSVGAPANMVKVNVENNEFKVLETYQNGELVYQQ